MTLRDVEPGQSGIVESIAGQGPLRRRLIDMGVTPGTRVFVTSVAPLGDPVKIVLRGYELSLRKDDAAKITILDGSLEGRSAFQKTRRKKGERR